MSARSRSRARSFVPASILRAWLAALLLGLTARAVASPAPALPPPMALGGECRLLVSCPWSGPLAAHLRIGGLVWSGQDGDPRPVSVAASIALSVSLWRWAETGAMFSARGGAAQDGGPALLQLPITLWARLSPQLDVEGGLQVSAEVRAALGRAPFDGGGTVYEDSQSYALSVGYRRSRVEAFLTGAYEEAGARSYQGLAAGGGLYVLLLRSLGLQLGAEALGRFGGEGRDMAPGWTAAAVLRFVDEHGISGTLGSGAGGGPGMPGRVPLAFFFGMSFGPSYRPHPAEPGYESLREAIEGWISERWRSRARYGLPLLPGFGPFAAGLPGLPAARVRDPQRITDPLAGYCAHLPGLPARAISVLSLRACVAAWSSVALPPPGAALLAGPAPPAPPAPPPGIAGGAPRPPLRGPGAMPRTGLRTGRGTGWSDPVGTPAGTTADGRPNPTFYTGGSPAGPTVGEVDAPRPPPSIPFRPQAPGPLPPGARADSVPPFLRPPAPRPPAPAPSPQPAERPGIAEHAAPLARGGAGPVRQGQRGVEDYTAAQQAAGTNTVETEVTFQTRYGRRRMDVIEVDPRTGEPVAVEVKTGNSPHKPMQRLKEGEIQAGRAVGVGPRAEKAGLAGPVKLQTKMVRLPAKEP